MVMSSSVIARAYRPMCLNSPPTEVTAIGGRSRPPAACRGGSRSSTPSQAAISARRCVGRSGRAHRPSPPGTGSPTAGGRRYRAGRPCRSPRPSSRTDAGQLGRPVTRRVAASALSTAWCAAATARDSHTGASPVLCSAATAWLTFTAYRRIANRNSSANSSRSTAWDGTGPCPATARPAPARNPATVRPARSAAVAAAAASTACLRSSQRTLTTLSRAGKWCRRCRTTLERASASPRSAGSDAGPAPSRCRFMASGKGPAAATSRAAGSHRQDVIRTRPPLVPGPKRPPMHSDWLLRRKPRWGRPTPPETDARSGTPTASPPDRRDPGHAAVDAR